MRLLNVNTFELSEFFEDDVPPYSILSHRWGKDEVSYQDFILGHKIDGAGFKKIRELCEVVKARKVFFPDYASKLYNASPEPLRWVWIDTCCIDKASSAELSEAINSMYKWYANAEECLVYMADVASPDKEANEQVWESFERSEWFTRGWTLQELLAPNVKVFYTSTWQILGHVIREANALEHSERGPRRGLHTLYISLDYESPERDQYYGSKISDRVSRCTGIQTEYLTRFDDISTASVARRMSWASQRRTQRQEDMAYCLLGLFDVNMPLLYGEGSKAFLRLQEEIIRRSDDQSIFAWCNKPSAWDNEKLEPPVFEVGLLAPHVEQFKGAGQIMRFHERPERPYSISNLGLQMQIKTRKVIVDISDPFCVPHAFELADVCFAQDMDRGLNVDDQPTYHNIRLIMLQCLHDKRRMWYRSHATDLLTGRTVSNQIQIPLLVEEKEPIDIEIFAVLNRTNMQQCYMCYDFDRRFEGYILALASQQGLLLKKNLPDNDTSQPFGPSGLADVSPILQMLQQNQHDGKSYINGFGSRSVRY